MKRVATRDEHQGTACTNCGGHTEIPDQNELGLFKDRQG